MNSTFFIFFLKNKKAKEINIGIYILFIEKKKVKSKKNIKGTKKISNFLITKLIIQKNSFINYMILMLSLKISNQVYNHCNLFLLFRDISLLET